jgi:hypothetical protein
MSDGSRRALLKDFVKKREVPSKPFVLPMIFSVAAKAEGIAPEQFLLNATKLSNTLKRVYQYYRYDGIMAYCRNHLESEILGCTVDRSCFPASISMQGEASLRDEIAPIEGLPYAVIAKDVFQRLRITVRDQQLLSVAFQGMMKLARLCFGQISDATLETASAGLLKLAQFFCQSGADVIFFMEDDPALDGSFPNEWWRNFRQVAKVIVYHEALPVLMFRIGNGVAAKTVMLQAEDFLPGFICDDIELFLQITDELPVGKPFGVGFSLDILLGKDLARLKDAVGQRKDSIVLLTTSDEIPYERFQPDLLQEVARALDEISKI